MAQFIIVETDGGLIVVEQDPNDAPEGTAMERGGVLVDPGPFESYDEAYDAIDLLEDEDERD